MPLSTDFNKKTILANAMYKEWLANTVLVNDCNHDYEGELNMQTREVKIIIYHDLKLYGANILEGELKPQPAEQMRQSELTIKISKVRYTHWQESTFSRLMDGFDKKGIADGKEVNLFAQKTEKELALWCATLPKKQTIDITNIFKTSGIQADGVIDDTNIAKAFQVIVSNIVKSGGTPKDFTLYVSEKLIQLLQEKKLGYYNNGNVFETGFVGKYLGLTIKQLEVPEITTRNDITGLVDAEWGILKAKEGINYVVPYKTFREYDVSPQDYLLGGKGYQHMELYDYFNIYPTRLYKVNLTYTKNKTAPTITEKDVLSVFDNK